MLTCLILAKGIYIFTLLILVVDFGFYQVQDTKNPHSIHKEYLYNFVILRTSSTSLLHRIEWF
jgi:hypothetical protein